MRAEYGNVKLQLNKWLIMSQGDCCHNLWHQCDTDRLDLWPVGLTTWSWWWKHPRRLSLRWRCQVCHRTAPDGIVGAFTLLETEYCVEQERRHRDLWR